MTAEVEHLIIHTANGTPCGHGYNEVTAMCNKGGGTVRENVTITTTVTVELDRPARSPLVLAMGDELTPGTNAWCSVCGKRPNEHTAPGEATTCFEAFGVKL